MNAIAEGQFSQFPSDDIYMYIYRDLLGLAVTPLHLAHLVNTGSIPAGPSHGEVCQLLIQPGDVL